MGRLSALSNHGRACSASACALASVLAILGCDPPKGDAPIAETGRSNAVTAASTNANPATAASPKAAPSASAPKPPRKLCADGPARTAPRNAPKTQAAPSAEAPPASIPFGTGKWIWVNLWAAWCGPCKEEIPRILNFQSRLRTAGVMIDVAFVSLDDDERQLTRFLESQPPAGLRASYWLPEGPSRDTWIGALGVTNAGNLPVHALVGPSGQVACLIQGAVEESDYQAISEIVSAKR